MCVMYIIPTNGHVLFELMEKLPLEVGFTAPVSQKKKKTIPYGSLSGDRLAALTL